MFRKTCVVIGLAFLAACAESQSGVFAPDRTIDEGFGEGELTWDRGFRVRYRLGLFEENGNYLICAATQNVRSNEDRQLLAAMKIVADGQTIQRGLGWARSYPTLASIDGEQAACRLTTFPVSPDPEISVELTKTRF